MSELAGWWQSLVGGRETKPNKLAEVKSMVLVMVDLKRLSWEGKCVEGFEREVKRLFHPI